ncbi:hypothetical protein AALC17_16780 [Oscillospiraceae bacterium 38-13]
MAKQYYIKKDPLTSGADIEWIAINGKDFYQLITSPAGKGRYFIDMGEFMIESTEAEYKDWRREKDHSDYLHEQESQVQLLSLYGGGDDSLVDLIPNMDVSAEETALHLLELQELTEALKMLDNDEYSLIYSLFLSQSCKTQSQLSSRFGLTQSGISRQKNRILEKLKFFVIKSKKHSQ